jgi:hypothetical protein
MSVGEALILFIFILVIIVVADRHAMKIKDRENERKSDALKPEITEWKNDEYNTLLQKYCVPSNAKTVTIGKRHLNGIKNYIFLSGGNLCLFPVFDEYKPIVNGKLLAPGQELKSDLRQFFKCV